MSVGTLEHEAAESGILSSPAHEILRDERSRSIVKAINAWVDGRIDSTPPKSPLGVALTYAKNQRKALSEFLGDPKLPLDNNASERALRIIAVGRNYAESPIMRTYVLAAVVKVA